MQLLPCQPPIGSLEAAPHSSLRDDSEQERWEGFWCENEQYRARCTRSDGSVQWYRIEDEGTVLDLTRRITARRFTLEAGRLTLNAVKRPGAMIVSTRANGHSMLVGTWQRRARAARTS